MKVLLVDDEKLAIKYYTQLINWQYYGFEIVGTAYDGKEALHILNEKKPDIIFTDIKMPVMDGIEFAQKARQINPDIHILFITSYTDFNYAYSALKLGVDDYIMKDIVSSDILVEKLLEIKKKMIAKSNENSYTVERVIEEMFINGTINHNQLEWLGQRAQRIYTGEFYYLLIKQDSPIPAAISSFLKETEKHNDSKIIIELCRNFPDEVFQPVSIFRKDDGIMTILKEKKNITDSRKALADYAFRLQSRCGQMLKNTYSIFLINKPHKLADAGREYAACQKFLRSQSFLSRSLIIEVNSPRLVYENINEVFDVSLITNYIHTNDIVKAHHYLENHFQRIIESKDLKAFDTVFYNCLSLFKKYGQELQSGKTFSLELTEPDRSMMYTVPDAMKWILNKLELLISIKSEGFSEQYSRDTQDIIKYIMNHYSNLALDVDNISKGVAMSTAKTEVKFKSETGLTLIDYLNKYRIKKAKELLENGDNKIYEISEKVGFASSQYFSKVFKKYTSLTPIEFRKRIIDETHAEYNI